MPRLSVGVLARALEIIDHDHDVASQKQDAARVPDSRIQLMGSRLVLPSLPRPCFSGLDVLCRGPGTGGLVYRTEMRRYLRRARTLVGTIHHDGVVGARAPEVIVKRTRVVPKEARVRKERSARTVVRQSEDVQVAVRRPPWPDLEDDVGSSGARGPRLKAERKIASPDSGKSASFSRGATPLVPPVRAYSNSGYCAPSVE